ncbi:MAG TPA: Gfo/Idh/MocA family oxidoreductase [Caldithrix abyssi]|uniref:Gfo/Idh/MocA family oxidoreductase n=1 Tax=Caldithrix abyssi TaxID=187145 RepID=A0A7V5VEE7_CALAY|nr:Gfo/Idh/MocA family oxidoreductase [Caldithrix abyssi]
MKKLKVAVVGAGKIAQIAHLPILAAREDVELCAVCDVDQGKARAITEKFNIPHWYFVVDEMIKKERPDAVHICTPSVYHYPMSWLALSKGIHVFVEKPISFKIEEALKLYDYAAGQKRVLMTSLYNRYRSDVRMLRQFIESGELGEIFYIKAGWLRRWEKEIHGSWYSEKKSSGGGVLMDMGIQLMDVALFLTAMPKIKKVRMHAYQLYENIEVEDAALVVLEAENGMTITIETSWKMFLEKDTVYTHVFGRKGSAKLNPLRIHKELHGNLVNVSPVSNSSTRSRFRDAYEHQIDAFIKAARGEAPERGQKDDVLEMMRLMEALYTSAAEGREVELS